MSITDTVIDVIIRSIAPADLARVQHICEAELDLEPAGGELPAILHQAPDCVGIVAETGAMLARARRGIAARAGDGEAGDRMNAQLEDSAASLLGLLPGTAGTAALAGAPCCRDRQVRAAVRLTGRGDLTGLDRRIAAADSSRRAGAS
jgi:hypothetical protein